MKSLHHTTEAMKESPLRTRYYIIGMKSHLHPIGKVMESGRDSVAAVARTRNV
jgi:hypothetical protein